MTAVPDAAGNAATPSITQQVDAFLAAQSFTGNELVLVNGGIADAVTQAEAARAGTISDAQALAAVQQAAVELAAQIKRMVTAGARRVAVAGAYDLGRSPYATQTGQASRLTTLAAEFNVKLKTELFGYNIADRVLYIDAEFYYNLVILNRGSPTYGSLSDVTSVACTSTDTGVADSIGTGLGQVTSARCDASTIASGINYATTLFADRLYFTPVANSVFGDYAFDRIRTRW
ncbi:MAG: GDSL family lipase [Comamonadaceae bacterium]|nr:MAG: GDSL family lipase [Comamonadaceae bacterium]